jgi:hypothetical protein
MCEGKKRVKREREDMCVKVRIVISLVSSALEGAS